MRRVAFILLFLVAVGCQIDGIDPFSKEPVVPNAKGRLARQLYLGGADRAQIRAEYRYRYDTYAKLVRLERYVPNRAGTMILTNYDSCVYDTSGRLARVIVYSGLTEGKLTAAYAREYIYPSQDYQVIETNRPTGMPRQFREEIRFRDGLSQQTDFFYVNERNQWVKQISVFRLYEQGRLVTDTHRQDTGELFSTNRYSYSGRRAQVEVVSAIPQSPLLSQVLLYDSKSRLIRQDFVNKGFDLDGDGRLGLRTVYNIDTVDFSIIYEYID